MKKSIWFIVLISCLLCGCIRKDMTSDSQLMDSRDVDSTEENENANGVRVAELDEMTYRKLLWSHRPLTDFWRVGHGYRKKLEEAGLYTMGDIARCSIGEEWDDRYEWRRSCIGRGRISRKCEF